MIPGNVDSNWFAVFVTLKSVHHVGRVNPIVWVRDSISFNNLGSQAERPTVADFTAEQHERIAAYIMRAQHQILLFVEAELAMAIGIGRFRPH